MLAKAQLGGYSRPNKINFTDLPLDSFYFDYFSIHMYNTYSFKNSIDRIFATGEMQKRPYQWYIGETGFYLDCGGFGIDQAKFFVSTLQAVNEIYEELSENNFYLKGIGIWSMFDYTNFKHHFGIISSEKADIEKRKAAFDQELPEPGAAASR